MYLPEFVSSASTGMLFSWTIEIEDVGGGAALVTPSGGKGGGGGDNPATCARSCYDCSNSGYPRCSNSTTCRQRYPNGDFPVGCYY